MVRPNRQAALTRIRKEDLAIERLCKLNNLLTPCLDAISGHSHVLEGDLRYLDELTTEKYIAIERSMNRHIAGLLIYLEETDKVRKTLDPGMKTEPETELETDFISADTGEQVLEAIGVIDDAVARIEKLQCELVKPVDGTREVSRTLEEHLDLEDHLTARVYKKLTREYNSHMLTVKRILQGYNEVRKKLSQFAVEKRNKQAQAFA